MVFLTVKYLQLLSHTTAPKSGCSDPLKPDLECVQGWDTSLCILFQCFTTLAIKKLLSYTQSKSLIFWYEKPCSVTKDPDKESVIFFLIVPL